MTPHRPIRILLVEDDPGDVLLTREALSDSKLLHDLHVAEDGAAALDAVEAAARAGKTFDLILLDLNLPKIDGLGVLRRLKGDRTTAEIPIVVLTTSDADEDVTASYGLHANAYVCKPVDFGRFHEVIRSIDEFFLTVVRLPTRA